MPSPAELIASPYDPEARYSTKREVEWVGYKVHLTETCEADTPHLIVNVETTPATTPDDHMVKRVHASLEPRDLLPTEHLVDKGYTDSQVLVESQRTYGVTLIGPVADDPSWQARAGTGFDKSQFLVDWDRQVVTCPMGKQSISWLPNTYPKNGMTWEVRFARKDCTPCPTGRNVPGPRRSHASWDSRRVSSMRRCKPPGNGRRPKRSASSMRLGQASRAPTRRASAGVASGKRAILGSPRPICSIWRLLRP